jgi:TolB-like protein
VRITARLIEAANETHLWSELYDLDLSECCGLTSGRLSLSVQSDVASRVVGALAFELVPSIGGTSLPLPVSPQKNR